MLKKIWLKLLLIVFLNMERGYSMIQMTLIQIDNYGPWTVTPRPRTESDLQILQARLFADLNSYFGSKKGLVFFTRFDNLLAIGYLPFTLNDWENGYQDSQIGHWAA